MGADRGVELEAEVAARGLVSRVRFLGHRQDLAQVLAAVDVSVLTSLWEGLPRVLVQSAAAGRPIVTFDVEGAWEVVREGENGFIVPSRDVDKLTARLDTVLRDRLRARAMGRIGRQQGFIRRLAQVAAAKAKRNPFAANRMANAVIPKLSVDAGLGKGDIFALVNTFRLVDPTNTSSIEMATLPTKGGPSYQGQSVLYEDQPAADALLARLRTFGPDPTQTQPGDDGPIDVVPSQVRVRVLNGSGTSGLAGTALADLRCDGHADGASPFGDGDCLEALIGNCVTVHGPSSRYGHDR